MLKPNRLVTRTSRRAVLGSAAALGAGVLMGGVRAQGSTPVASPSASPVATPVAADGEWSFTDDKGVTVTLPQRPTRLVMDLSAAAPLWDFGIKPLAVSGWTTSTDVAWGNVDRSIPDITNSSEAGIPNPEEMLALEPELYINITWDPSDPLDYWGFPDQESIDLINAIAPMVAISATGLADVNTERFAELAASLGADLQSPELVEAKTGFDNALTSFQQTAEEKADLTAIFWYAGATELYVASPRDWADLHMYQERSLNIVEPEAEPGAYWEQLSLEEALRYPADVLFQSTRDGVLSLDEIKEHPTLGQHPAVLAGQVGWWNQDFIMSYQGMTSALDNLAATISTANKIT